MPQPQKYQALSVVYHPLCPNCLNPMHIRTAQVAAGGRAKIDLICGTCETEVVKETHGGSLAADSLS
jgi:hypothetical protein